MASIPADVTEITPDWLNAVTGQDVGEITDVTVDDVATGVGILARVSRVRPTYAAGAEGPGGFIVKTTSPAPENVALCQAMGFYEREVRFYQGVAESLEGVLRVPKGYHAEIDATGAQMVVVMEEITDARCPDQISGLSLSDTEAILDTVARLHARYWNDEALDTWAWLPPMNNPLYKAGHAMAQVRWPPFVERYGDQIDSDTLDAVGRLVMGPYPEYLDWQAARGNTTFTHTDCRAENYLFGGSGGDICVLDFQLCTRHVGVWDVANLLGASLTPEVRRAHQDQLVGRYHDAITGLGVDGYSLDRCWEDLRACLLHQCVAQVITAELAGGDERGEELLFHLHLRPFLMAADVGVTDLPAQVGA